MPNFHQITKEHIQVFTQELSIFAESFNMHGPGAVGDDLEKGAAVTSFIYTITYYLLQSKRFNYNLTSSLPSLGRLPPAIHLGLAVMDKYEAELAKMEGGRQQLANAEKLFDLSFTMYPELLQVQRDMKGLKLIYDTYRAQKVCFCLPSIPGCILYLSIGFPN